MSPCVFCELIEANDDLIDFSTSEWVTFRPIGPVNEGHALIVPVRHIERFEQLEQYEARELPEVLDAAIDYYMGGTDYNLGVNAGSAAGQTVFHLHIHLIPRMPGDVEDPAGGIMRALGDQLGARR